MLVCVATYMQPGDDIVGFYLAGITVLYGVTLGLLAIGAWMTYTDTEAKVARAAAALDNPYRGKISVNPEPLERVYRQVVNPHPYAKLTK